MYIYEGARNQWMLEAMEQAAPSQMHTVLLMLDFEFILFIHVTS